MYRRRWAVSQYPLRAETFNGSTSYVQLVSDVRQSGLAQSIYCAVRITSAAAAAGGYLFSALDASSRNGVVFRVRGDTNRLSFLGDSTGGANTPSKTGTSAWVSGRTYHLCATWDGGITAAGISLYWAENDNPLLLETPSVATDGSGSPITPGSGNNQYIGNNSASARGLGGGLLRLVRWNGILSRDQFDAARWGMPPGLVGDVIYDRYNGYDHGPYGELDVVVANITVGEPSPYVRIPRIYVRSRRREGVAGGGTTFDVEVVEGSATATDAPSATVITPQLTYPVADIALNGWLPSSDSTLYPMLDETAADFADFIYSPGNPTTQQFEVKLGALGDPVSSVNHGVQIALQAIGFDTNFDFNLVQGSTILDSWTELVTVAQGQVTRTRNFSGAVADSITDYSDLRIRGVARA